MPHAKYSPKQKRLAAVAAKKKITKADFDKQKEEEEKVMAKKGGLGKWLLRIGVMLRLARSVGVRVQRKQASVSSL